MRLCIYSAAFLYILLRKIFFILLGSNCISLRLKMQQRIFHIRMYVVSKGRSSPGGCGGQLPIFIARTANRAVCKNLDSAPVTAHRGILFYLKSQYQTQSIWHHRFHWLCYTYWFAVEGLSPAPVGRISGPGRGTKTRCRILNLRWYQQWSVSSIL